MRLINLILWDIRFQVKYGFYILYGLLTVLYLGVLYAMPEAWRGYAAALLIFSDPAAMGLFFMGAIVLLEKSQRVPYSFAVSPVRAIEYIIAKVVSLNFIALVAAAILAIAARVENLAYLLLGTALSGAVFTLLGIIIATKITSLNQFVLWTVPIEIIGFVPGILHLFGIGPKVLGFYPACICMDMIAGSSITVIKLFLVLGLIAVLFVAAHQCVLIMWKSEGGAKL